MNIAAAEREAYILVLVTASSDEEAEAIAQALVREGLAACVTLLPKVKSIYIWEGEVEAASECLMMIKTRTPLFSPLAEKVKEMHSYEVPEIIALPFGQGESRYLEWINQVTRPGR